VRGNADPAKAAATLPDLRKLYAQLFTIVHDRSEFMRWVLQLGFSAGDLQRIARGNTNLDEADTPRTVERWFFPFQRRK
jgi:hypothetical protein